MYKRSHFSTILFLIIFPGLFSTAWAQTPGPIIERCTPTSVSANSVLECEGFRLGAESIGSEKVKAIFTRAEARIAGRTGGSSSITNNSQKGRQSLDVIVPEEIGPGRWQLVIEVDNLTSNPVTIEIGEWTPPRLITVNPSKVIPGQMVWLSGSNLHINDEIEITDAFGRVRRFSSGASASSTGFTAPRNLPEGETTVRIGLASRDSFSEPVKFVVTSDPIALELWPNEMTKVAPGQWTNLVATSLDPLKKGDGVEVEFRQGEQVMVQLTSKPESTHVQIPAALKPGVVELRTRTLRRELVSEWSKSIVYEILERPVAPFVSAIEMGDKGKAVFLWEGPDRPASFEVQPGYELVLRGNFPAAGPNRLVLNFQGAAERFSITPAEAEREGLLIVLPKDLQAGNWKLSISDLDSGITAQLPVIMQVK
jgi:hypothetical protein